MLMYREFRSKIDTMDFTDRDSNPNPKATYVPVFEEKSIKRSSSCPKMIRPSSKIEKLMNPMKVLMLFPERSHQIKNLATFCDSLNVVCHSIWSAEEAITALHNNGYDIVIVDRRPYDIGNLDVDQLIFSIRRDAKIVSTKIISFSDRVFEDYSILWSQGYDEQWVNYNDACALKNYLDSYLRNQYLPSVQNKKMPMLQSVFDKFVDSIAILNKDFTIETVNFTFLNHFKLNSKNVIGQNWFIVHKIPIDKMTAIINEIKMKRKWHGSISADGEDTHIFSNQIHIVIMSLDTVSNQYVVYINTDSLYHSRSDHSISSVSIDQDNTTSMIKKKDTFLSHSQISVESPILKIMKIINNIQDLANPMISNQLQKIVDILTSKDLFITTVDALKTDKMSSNLIDGLLSNNATIFAQTEIRRNTTSMSKRRQTRDNSEILNDHINQVLSKISKISEIPENEEISDLEELLRDHRNWSFDILRLEVLSEFKPLRHIGMKVFKHFDVGNVLKIDGSLFQNWLYIIESNYNDSNTYHNSTHAADVLQSSAWFLERERINEIFDSFDDTISIIAAIVHDLGHPGRTNPFLINSNSNLAVLYNDIAVLENHHAAFAFKLTLKDERINIFKNLNSDDYRILRHGIIDAVLATEMAKHFEHLTKFANSIVKQNDHNDGSQISNLSESINGMDLKRHEILSQPHNKAIIRRMLIKCSDVNNPSRPFSLCEQWAKRISEEYFNQTDDEIARNIPIVMPQFNRRTCDIPQSQISFIEIFLEDMFALWHEFADTEELLVNLRENKVKWKAISKTKSEPLQMDPQTVNSGV